MQRASWVVRALLTFLVVSLGALAGPASSATHLTVRAATVYNYDGDNQLSAGTPAPAAVASPTDDATRAASAEARGAGRPRAASRFAAEGGGGIVANQAAGNAARDAIAARYAGSVPEASFSTPLGARRVDVLTRDGLAIESKVGRTSLTSSIQAQINKDAWLMQNNPAVSSVQWVFSPSGVTGQIGPTGPLGAALDKAGISWILG